MLTTQELKHAANCLIVLGTLFKLYQEVQARDFVIMHSQQGMTVGELCKELFPTPVDSEKSAHTNAIVQYLVSVGLLEKEKSIEGHNNGTYVIANNRLGEVESLVSSFRESLYPQLIHAP